MKKYLFIIIILSLWACEKDITVDIPHPDKSVVVEGYIENGQVPYVILTQNSPYFETVDLNSLQNLVVTNALVTVSDGQFIDTLKFAITPNKFPFVAYIGSKKAEYGKTYDLQIVYLNDTLRSQTTILEPITLDSLVFKPDPEFIKDSLGYVWVFFKDSAATTDYYRVNSMILGEDSFYLHPYRSVLDDKILNGTQFQFPTYHGITGLQGANSDTIPNDSTDSRKDLYFKAGQKVIVKISHIDVETFLFWQSIEMQAGSGGNPFSSPSTIKGNIENGLGNWGGYGATIDTLELKMPEK